MRAIIIGLGSVGRRHLENLRYIEPDANITVWHQHRKPSKSNESLDLADKVVYNLSDALADRSDIAIIANPSSLHVETANKLANHGIHLLIEKPLSNNLDGVDELIDLCERKGVVLLVGYNMRFYEPMQVMHTALHEGQIGRILYIRAEVGQSLPEWRVGMDYRKSVSARSELGGGVLLELSHEIDYARWLVGEVNTVNAQVARLGNLDIDVEDTAEIILGYRDGAIGSLHLDMIQRAAKRSCHIIGTEGTIIWDGESHRVSMFLPSTKSWTDLHPAKEIDRNEMYIEELKYFIKCSKRDASPNMSGEDGRRVLQIVLAAKQSSTEHRTIGL